jgi:hypothetical protein
MIKDAKKFIQIAWVTESILLLLLIVFAFIFMAKWRLELLAPLITPIIGVIFTQGAAASIGPEVKRAIETKKEIEIMRIDADITKNAEAKGRARR